jgi:hypothetical protein
MYRKTIRLVLGAVFLFLLCLLCSCQAFNRVDTYGTAQAQNFAFETEVAEMTQVSQAQEAAAVATVEAGETTVALINGVNQQLVATLQRQVTPTPQIQIEGVQPLDPALQAQYEGKRLFVKTGTSSEVNQADGCIINPQVFFTEDATRIYGTLKVYNVEAGVLMRAEWKREGTPVWEDVWTVDANYAEICIWFYIEPAYVEFTPGAWSVEMFADGFSLEGPMTFSIQPLSQDLMMDEP